MKSDSVRFEDFLLNVTQGKYKSFEFLAIGSLIFLYVKEIPKMKFSKSFVMFREGAFHIRK